MAKKISIKVMISRLRQSTLGQSMIWRQDNYSSTDLLMYVRNGNPNQHWLEEKLQHFMPYSGELA